MDTMENFSSNSELCNVRDMLASLPTEQWTWLKSEVAGLRRESADTTTKSGAKLFGPGIEAGVSRLALVFTDGSSGVYNVEARESGKGRTGSVRLSLKHVTTGEVRELNSREHGAMVAECIVQRRERQGNKGNGNAAQASAMPAATIDGVRIVA